MKKAMVLLCLAVALIASTQELYAGRYFVPEMARWATPDPALRDKLPNQLVQIQDGKLLSTSPYVYTYDNPLKYTDPDGKIPTVVVGAISGAALDIGLQVATNYFQGRPLTDISWKQVAISAGAGAVGAGLASKAGQLLRLASKADDVVNIADDVAKGVTNLADDAAKGISKINPSEVRFSQSSIKATFKEGGSIDELAAGLRSGKISPESVPPIRVVEINGKLYTLDNRRLEAFRRAGVEIRYRLATPEEAAKEGWKFTTTNEGVSIRVRGGQ